MIQLSVMIAQTLLSPRANSMTTLNQPDTLETSNITKYLTRKLHTDKSHISYENSQQKAFQILRTLRLQTIRRINYR